MSPTNPPPATLSLQDLYDLLRPITAPASSPRAKFINWGLTFTCSPLSVLEPENEYHCELILELARREGRTVRAAGVGHSPSDLACTTGYMLRTEKLDGVLEVSDQALSQSTPRSSATATRTTPASHVRNAYIP